jgi:hypothetical protein
MKNLANCTPTEFLVQTNKIRKSVEAWLKATDIANIRARKPQLIPITKDMTDDEKLEATIKNKIAMKEQTMANLSLMFDNMLEKDADKTAELLALINFVEPKDVNNYKIVEYLANINDLLEDEDVVSFFTSLMRLAQMNTSGVAKR